MAQTFYSIPPVDVTPGSTASWQDVDCSSHIPEGATGVILRIRGTYAAFNVGIRKKGSSDDEHSDLAVYHYTWGFIGVDASRVFQTYIEDTGVTIWLVGYTTTGVTFNTNGVSKTPSFNSWQDIDCSSEAPNATALIFEIRGQPGNGAYQVGLRKKGSTDDRHCDLVQSRAWIIVGCNASQVCQAYIEDSAGSHYTLYLIGYVTDGVTFFDNASDKSLGVTGTWTDISCQDVAPGALMLFFEVYGNSNYQFDLRKKGSSENIYQYTKDQSQAFIEPDENGKVEGKISNVACDFFLRGYCGGGLIAGFSGSPTEGPVPLEVQFTDATGGGTPPYTYTWDFGDDSPVSHEQNPKHTYAAFGYYTVKLTITDDALNEDVEEKVNYIFATPPEVLTEIDPADKTPASMASWVDVDASAIISVDSTGVLLHVINESATEYECGIRKKGSTDDIKGKLAAYAHSWAFIGVDASQKFQAYIENTNVKIYVVGYSLYGMAFLDNAVDKTPGSTGWQDIDCSGQVEHDPDGLIFMVKNITADALRSYGIRKNGSTDEYTQGQAGYLNIAAGNIHFVMIGCDESQISEFQLSNTGDLKLYLIGYVFGGMTFFTNAYDKSLDSPFAEYRDVDISAQAATSAWGIMQVNCKDKAGRYAAMRYKGSSEDEYHQVTYGTWKPQHCNTSHIFEAKIQDGNVDFWIVGYVHETELQFLTISGVVKIGAIKVQGAHVLCYNLTKSEFVDKTLTDADGEYTFINAGYQYELFLVAAHYDDGVNYYGIAKKVQLEEE
jgi:PKD repeat protein